MYPSTVSVVRDFIARQTESHVPSTEPGVRGQVANYDGSVAQIGCAIHDSNEDFRTVDESFRAARDLEGSSMLEIARRYWDDPDFAENQRKQIAEAKARKARRGN